MRQYHDLMKHIFAQGAVRANRTRTDARSIFGHQMRFDIPHRNVGSPILV